MACNFIIEFTEPIETLIEKAKKGITSEGGTFKGDAVNGEYSIPVPTGTIRGTYSVKGKKIAFVITNKPPLPTCNRIEKELRKYLEGDAPERMTFE